MTKCSSVLSCLSSVALSKYGIEEKRKRKRVGVAKKRKNSQMYGIERRMSNVCERRRGTEEVWN